MVTARQGNGNRSCRNEDRDQPLSLQGKWREACRCALPKNLYLQRLQCDGNELYRPLPNCAIDFVNNHFLAALCHGTGRCKVGFVAVQYLVRCAYSIDGGVDDD